MRILNTKRDLHLPSPHSVFYCLTLSLVNLLVAGAFQKTRRCLFIFFFCADRSVHVSNLQHIGIEVTVNIWSQMEREECLQLCKSLGLINAWENITTSALSFLLWHEACQASLKLLTHAKSNTAFLLFCSPHSNTPLLVSNTLHWVTGPYIVKMWSLIFT